jgi:hypothetical protein
VNLKLKARSEAALRLGVHLTIVKPRHFSKTPQSSHPKDDKFLSGFADHFCEAARLELYRKKCWLALRPWVSRKREPDPLTCWLAF